MGCSFVLEGVTFQALNGGPQYKFNPAISLLVDCTDQQEVDELWTKLLSDPARANRAVQAMLGMQKIDIASLKKAAGPAS